MPVTRSHQRVARSPAVLRNFVAADSVMLVSSLAMCHPCHQYVTIMVTHKRTNVVYHEHKIVISYCFICSEPCGVGVCFVLTWQRSPVRIWVVLPNISKGCRGFAALFLWLWKYFGNILKNEMAIQWSFQHGFKVQIRPGLHSNNLMGSPYISSSSPHPHGPSGSAPRYSITPHFCTTSDSNGVNFLIY